MSGEPSDPVSRRDALRITAVAGTTLALGGGLVAALLRAGRLHRVRVTKIRMGTLVTVTAVHPERAEGRAMVDAAFSEMERLERILSRHRADTPVARLNREGSVHAAPPELVEVVRRARAFSVITRGAFDVTMAPLLELYGARFEAGRPPPTESELSDTLARVDYRDLRLEGSTVRFERPGMALTLDGIAKGYIVDRTLDVLLASGAEGVLVDGGGDMASSAGAGLGEPWWVSIRHPRDGVGSLGELALRGEGVATSGDYVHAFTEDRSSHHIIDPRTGRSPGETASVTVVAPTATESDALSTAAFVMGPSAGLALLETQSGVEGLIVGKDGGAVETEGFRRYRG